VGSRGRDVDGWMDGGSDEQVARRHGTGGRACGGRNATSGSCSAASSREVGIVIDTAPPWISNAKDIKTTIPSLPCAT